MLMLKTATVLGSHLQAPHAAPCRSRRPCQEHHLCRNPSAEDSLVLLDATADGLTAGQAAERPGRRRSQHHRGADQDTCPPHRRRLHRPLRRHPRRARAGLALHRRARRARAAARPSTVIVIGIMLLVSGGMKFIRKHAAAMRQRPSRTSGLQHLHRPARRRAHRDTLRMSSSPAT